MEPEFAERDFAAYMAARWRRLVCSAVFMGSSPADAEDLVQTAFMRCWVSWGKVAAARDVDAYVYQVLLNCLAKSRRRHWWGEIPSGDAVQDAEPVVDIADDVTTVQLFREALQELPVDQRRVVVLRYYADLSEPQVAAVLGIAVGTVKSRSSRGLARLQASLDGLHLTTNSRGASS